MKKVNVIKVAVVPLLVMLLVTSLVGACTKPPLETPPLEPTESTPTSPVTSSPPPSVSAVPTPTPLELSQVKVAVLFERVTDHLYERVTDHPVSDIENIIDMLRETKTDFVFRGFIKWSPIPPESLQFQEQDLVERSELGDDFGVFGILRTFLSEMKQQLPSTLFCGAIAAQIIGKQPAGGEWNSKTGEHFERADLWEMATDPGKWGINVSKERFQYDFAQWHQWVPPDLDYELYDWRKAEALLPDITNARYQELLLSWAQQQIDYGADAIWIDVPFWQANMLHKITKDVTHPAVKESYEAVSKIVDEIHKYGELIGKRIYVGSWSESYYFPPPDFDFVTLTPEDREVEEMRLDSVRWDRELTDIRKRYGDIPIFVFIDWGPSNSALSQFTQRLSREEQMEFLKIADDFFYRNDVIFTYPIRGGSMGNDPIKLSFGREPAYDSTAPEFQLYDTIKQLALSKRQR